MTWVGFAATFSLTLAVAFRPVGWGTPSIVKSTVVEGPPWTGTVTESCSVVIELQRRHARVDDVERIGQGGIVDVERRRPMREVLLEEG